MLGDYQAIIIHAAFRERANIIPVMHASCGPFLECFHSSGWTFCFLKWPKGLSKNKVANLRDVTRANLSKIIYVILGQTLRVALGG